MKNSFPFTVMFILLLSVAFLAALAAQEDHEQNEPASLMVSPDLRELGTALATAYQQENPGIKLQVSGLTRDNLSGMVRNGDILAIITEKHLDELKGSDFWKAPVGRDVIVPVLNKKNPVMEELRQKGMSALDMVEMLCKRSPPEWGYIGEAGEGARVHCFMLNDEAVQNAMATFTGKSRYELKARVLPDASSVIKAVNNDRYAIGFCSLADIVNAENQIVAENICILPIDKDGDGRITHHERIYDDMSEFCRAVWIGKYPQELILNLYAVSGSQPGNTWEIPFLKWLLTSGQHELEATGYTGLTGTEKNSAMASLMPQEEQIAAATDRYSLFKAILIILAVLLVAAVVVSLILRSRRKNTLSSVDLPPKDRPHLKEQDMKFPAGLHYDKTHTWEFREKDGNVRIGISDFLQHIAGTFTNISMKKTGDTVKKNDPVLWLMQDGKQLTVYSPVSGTIVQANQSLKTDPTLINESPYDKGWLYVIEPSNWSREVEFLKVAENYREWLRFELVRLRDFLAVKALGSEVRQHHVNYQDNDELFDGVLMNFGPEVWEDFQKNFIDPPLVR
ncbi:MAG: hypothetical protein ACOCX8_01735 [Bacteroidota bacterium]